MLTLDDIDESIEEALVGIMLRRLSDNDAVGLLYTRSAHISDVSALRSVLINLIGCCLYSPAIYVACKSYTDLGNLRFDMFAI